MIRLHTATHLIYDIIAYISGATCDGVRLIPCVKTHNTTLSYTIDIRTEDGFAQTYTLEQEDMYRLETIRMVVNNMIDDFCNKYRQIKLDNFYKSLTETK